MTLLLLFCIALMAIAASPALAHGCCPTADEGDKNINIQVYTAYNWGSNLTDSIHKWNHLHTIYGDGPRFTLVNREARAEVVVEPTGYGAGVYARVRPNVGPDVMRINPSRDLVYKDMLHEEGHGLGMDDHFTCDGIRTIMSYCYYNEVFGLTAHDRAFYRRL